jgi:hypothetical protein
MLQSLKIACMQGNILMEVGSKMAILLHGIVEHWNSLSAWTNTNLP